MSLDDEAAREEVPDGGKQPNDPSPLSEEGTDRDGEAHFECRQQKTQQETCQEYHNPNHYCQHNASEHLIPLLVGSSHDTQGTHPRKPSLDRVREPLTRVPPPARTRGTLGGSWVGEKAGGWPTFSPGSPKTFPSLLGEAWLMSLPVVDEGSDEMLAGSACVGEPQARALVGGEIHEVEGRARGVVIS